MAAIQIDGEDATLIFIEDEDALTLATTNAFLVNYTAFVVDPVVEAASASAQSKESWE